MRPSEDATKEVEIRPSEEAAAEDVEFRPREDADSLSEDVSMEEDSQELSSPMVKYIDQFSGARSQVFLEGARAGENPLKTGEPAIFRGSRSWLKPLKWLLRAGPFFVGAESWEQV